MEAKDIDEFAAALSQQITAWVEIFKEVPATNKRRKDALQGAMKLKKATKSLEGIAEDPAGPYICCQV